MWVAGWEGFSPSCAGQGWTCHWYQSKQPWCSLIGTSGGTAWWGLHWPWAGPQLCWWCNYPAWADGPEPWCCAGFSGMEARQFLHNGSFPLGIAVLRMWSMRCQNKLLLVGFYHYQVTGSNVEWSWSQSVPKLASLPFWSITQPHWDPRSWHNGGSNPTWSACFVLKFTCSTSAELTPW